MVPNVDDSSLIDALGGTTATAVLCRIRPQAVSQWRINGIPPARRMYLELLKSSNDANVPVADVAAAFANSAKRA